MPVSQSIPACHPPWPHPPPHPQPHPHRIISHRAMLLLDGLGVTPWILALLYLAAMGYISLKFRYLHTRSPGEMDTTKVVERLWKNGMWDWGRTVPPATR